MVSSTTKTLNYTIDNGMDKNNTVNATITSTPGFNGGYLGKIPGILKFLSLILCIISLVLVAYLRQEGRLNQLRPASQIPQFLSNESTTTTPFPLPGTTVVPFYNDSFTYNKEMFLAGEVYFLCAHTALLTLLMVFILSYLFHTVSSMIVPKASTIETTALMLLALMVIIAGIVEIVQTEMWKQDPNHTENRLMTPKEEGIRVAAGALAIINGIVLIVAWSMARKELNGPHSSMGHAM